MSSFAETQKFRVVGKGVDSVVRKSMINEGLSYQHDFNCAVQDALAALERTRRGNGIADQCAVGINGTWRGFSIQLNAVE